MDFLKRGFNSTIRVIKKNKGLFFVLIGLQLLLIVLLIFVSINYQIKIIENAKTVIEPLQDANFDPESIKEGQPFMEDIVPIYKGYKSMVRYIWYYVSWLAGIFIVLNGSIWILTQRLFGKKNYFKLALKFLSTSFVLLVPFFITAYLSLKWLLGLQLEVQNFSSILQIVFWAFFVLYYFILVTFAFIDISFWKNFFKKIYSVGIKRVYYTLIVLFINLVLIFIGLYSIYLTSNEEALFPLMILAATVLILIMVLTRIFWIACLKEIK
jgi:hypothetical protein